MMNGNLTTWDDARVDELRTHWTGGQSAAKIGVVMGLTRNAVLGKAHRLGLAPRISEFTRELLLKRKTSVRIFKPRPLRKTLTLNPNLQLPRAVPIVERANTIPFKRPDPLTKNELRAILTQAVKNTAAMS